MANHRDIGIRAFCVVHLMAPGALAYASDAGGSWRLLIGLALLMCQCALLATWIALGKSPGRFRKTMLLLYVAGLVFILAKSGLREVGDGLIEMIVVAFLGAGLLTFLALPWIRVQRRGFELIDLCESPLQGAQKSFQFSLRQAFFCTALAALLLAYGQWLHRLDEIDGTGIRKLTASFAVFIACCGLPLQYVSLMLLAGWAALSPGDCLSRLAVVHFAALILGPLLPYYGGGGPRDYGFSTVLWVAYVALLSASLLFFRACGYRLVRIDRTYRPQPK